jgi:RNA polymerase sigma-70 factor, ECF subfamily
MNDHDAINRLKHGDIGGLEWLVSRYQMQAVRAAFLITQDVPLAEDVAQEAFLNAYRKIHQFDASRPFMPWFMRSVIHLAVKKAQKQAKQLPFVPEPEDGTYFEKVLAARGWLPEEQVEAAEFRQQVHAALRQLSPRQRAVVVQRYFLEMGEKEMADELGVALGTVKWLLNAARKNLRALLGAERKMP